MCLSSGGDFYFPLLSPIREHTWALKPLSHSVSGQIYIERPFAYQAAAMRSAHHLSLIYREMHVALTLWRARPLYLHLPSAAVSYSISGGRVDSVTTHLDLSVIQDGTSTLRLALFLTGCSAASNKGICHDSTP